MHERVLAYFPAHTHPLTLVSDPDGVLAEEELLAGLAARGFTLLSEPDPVALRLRVEAARPWSAGRPLVIVTAGALNALPYDLWQEGRRLTLALHTFFPHLSYPLLRALSPAQRWRLAQVPQPARPLAQRTTADYLLQHVFGWDDAALSSPAAFIAWLDGYHSSPDPLPPALAARLLERLKAMPGYRDWPLEQLLAGREAFLAFLRDSWLAYLQEATGRPLRERSGPYALHFAADPALQDALPRLLRSGALPRVALADPARLPAWAQPGVLAGDESAAPCRAQELITALRGALSSTPGPARWEDWAALARQWAALGALRHDPRQPLPGPLEAACRELEPALDAAWLTWLRGRYSALGAQRLPVPHQVHHVPHYIAYRRRQESQARVALIVLDGLALADWLLVAPVWRARHAGWRLQERLLLAQVPTITAVSRQALISGLRPADFAPTLGSNAHEAQQWAAFWAREDLAPEACAYAHLALAREGPPAAAGSSRTRALCLVDNTFDDLLHGATLGAAGVQAQVELWLRTQSPALETLIADLLAQGDAVYLASDHGHVQARGIGQPGEGVLVDSRCRRARVYSSEAVARAVQQAFADTVLWADDGLLPPGVHALMPADRGAFAPFGETVVTHGGLTLDEVVVPLIEISSSL